MKSLRLKSLGEYGLPYQGSKTGIINEIAKIFPSTDHFYDLFGGGFSCSHYMLANRARSYKHFHYNEIRPGLCELIQDAIAGKYNYNVFKPEWISREKFLSDKEKNAYIKILWSFGNDGESYIFGKDIEQQKRSRHQAVVFDEFDDCFIKTFHIKKWPLGLGIKARRLFIRKIVRNEKGRIDFEQLQQLQQLQQLERLERLERLNFTTLDYRQVKIHPNSVIYCDIPYQSTSGYGSEFNHKDFFDWADAQENPVFISEYKINDNRFKLIKEIKHRTSFSATKNSSVTERVYGNKAAAK